MTIRQRLANALFGDIIAAAARDAAAAVSIRIDDSAGWHQLSGMGPQDRPWSELYQNLEDALEAWRKNFFVRRLVTLTRSYVVAGGITITSQHGRVERFARDFWDHPQNRLDRRLGPMCDELTRSGELFVVLFTNAADGMSYTRFVPASQIHHIETDPDDYEKELRFGQAATGLGDDLQAKWWLGVEHPEAFKPDDAGSLPPVMLHFAVNRPIGATRGEGDLGPVLPWALRYAKWLEDRVRLNRIRTRQALLDVEIADDSQVETKKRELASMDPVSAGIYVHGPGEKVTAHPLQINAADSAPDGKALRLAIATGANTGLHYLGEGEATNYATAREMGEPAARFYTERQTDFADFLVDLVQIAHRRAEATPASRARPPARDNYQLSASVTEVARADNLALAQAASSIVEALNTMKINGWIDDANAARLALKFAGEAVSQDEIRRILEEAEADPPPPEPEAQEPAE